MLVDFIETYDDVLTADFCALLIGRFERSRRKLPGATGNGVDLQKKNSVDLNISTDPEWTALHAQVVEKTWPHLVGYVRKYVDLLTSAVVLSVPTEKGEPLVIDRVVAQKLSDRTIELLLRRLYRLGEINLQRYERGVGGYHHWHSEIHPQAGDPEQQALHRVLLFMYYLNDVEVGGETEFHFQHRTVRPHRGQLVIAPCGWSHTHRGNIPRSSHKYILTSWVSFQSAEQLFGGDG